MKKLLLLALLIAASASMASAGESKGHILFVPSSQGAYMIRAWDLAKDYAEDKGYTIELQGPISLDPVGVSTH